VAEQDRDALTASERGETGRVDNRQVRDAVPVEIARDRPTEEGPVRLAVLFGSLARGQAGEDSEPTGLKTNPFLSSPSRRTETARCSLPMCRAISAEGCASIVYHGILGVMAKVMVSMPDDLLSEVDAEATRLGTSRSAVLREFADSALRRRRTDRAAAMDRLLRQAERHGGASAERVKASRP
jgi:hypothetical protein